MSAKIITFDVDYIANQMQNIEKAYNLTEEAMGIIKKANQHRNWKCYETKSIENSMSNMLNKLSRLNTGIIGAGNALGNEFVRFRELEQRAMGQANTLADNLRNESGFSASNYSNDEATTLDVTQIPLYTRNIVPGMISTFFATEGDIPEKVETLIGYLNKRMGASWGALMGFLANGGAGLGESVKDLKNLVSKFITNLSGMTELPADASLQDKTEKFCQIYVDFISDTGESIEGVADTAVQSSFGLVKGWFEGMGIDTIRIGNREIKIDEILDNSNKAWDFTKDVVKKTANVFIDFGKWIGDNLIKPNLPWG